MKEFLDKYATGAALISVGYWLHKDCPECTSVMMTAGVAQLGFKVAPGVLITVLDKFTSLFKKKS